METGKVTEDVPPWMLEAGRSASSEESNLGSAPQETHQSFAISPNDVPITRSVLFFTYPKKSPKMGKWMIIFAEVVVSVLFLGFLIAFLTGHVVKKNHVIWALEPWKWCMLVLVIVGSRHITGWMINLVVFLIKKTLVLSWIEKKFPSMKHNVYYSYYIYSLRKSVHFVLWFGSVLLTWFFLFKSSGVKRSKFDSQVLKYIQRTIATSVIGGFIWVLKTLLVSALSSPFQATRLFDRFRKSFIDQYILQVFSAKTGKEAHFFVEPGKESHFSAEPRKEAVKWINRNHLPSYDCGTEDKGLKVINWLKKIKPAEISAWTMKELIKVVRSTLSSITEDLETLAKKERDMTKLFEETVKIANQIFARCLSTCDGADERKIEEYIQELFNEEAREVVQHINGGEEVEEKMLGMQALRKWLVDAVVERRTLSESLENTERTIEELNKIISGTALVMLFMLWLIMLGVLTTQVVVAILTQFVALAFIFGETGKNIFQGIVFVFVMHPIDIGDCCLINGEKMVVERIDLLSSVFRKNWKEKIVFPNSILTTTTITKIEKVTSHVVNDSVEISISWHTSTEQIRELQEQIKSWFLTNNEHKDKWLGEPEFTLKGMEDQKLKIVLGVSYRNTGLRSDMEIIPSRRDLLVLNLKSIFDRCKIICHQILLKAIDAE